MNSATYSTQFFDQQSAGSLASARVVLEKLFDYLSIKAVIDVGCGVAPWLRAAIDLGANYAIGLDGDYVDRGRLLIEPTLFRSCDLESENLRHVAGDDRPFDLAICMEVAEHLPASRAPSFIEQLCGLSDLVLFSAAIPGQGGANHVNEQWPQYWAALFANSRFACFDVLRSRIWCQNECEWWYLQNILLFARENTEGFEQAKHLGPSTDNPMPIVHPRMLSHISSETGRRILELEQVARYQPFGRDAGIRTLEARVDQLRLMVLDKESKIETLTARLRQVLVDLTSVHAERDLALREKAAMLDSTSWRITAPLRTITTQLRRLFGAGGVLDK